jgi:hypothetical protein
VVKSLKDRIRNRYNVSVAEVDHLEARQRSTLGVAMVCNDSAYIHGCFDKIVETVRSAGGASLIDFEKEIL